MAPRTDAQPRDHSPRAAVPALFTREGGDALAMAGPPVVVATTPYPPPPAPTVRETGTIPLPEGSTLLPVLGVSVAAHALLALALGALGVVPALALETESFVEVALSAPPDPEVAPTPPPEPEPAAIVPPPRVERERPRPVVPEPPPEPTAAPPSLDEVFGDEPAPPAEVMTADGPGGFAIDPGSPGGVPGGRAGGTGEGVGSGGGSPPVAVGPTDADRRRARRAYVRSLEGLLGGHVRYPRAAARERLQGRAEICLRVGDDGRVLGSRMCGSAGHELLDDAALEAAHELERVPAPPALAAWSPTDEIHAGVVFVVR